MPTLERITPETALRFKEVRLRALADTPMAFGSTFAKESQLTDADWLTRSIRWSTEGHIGLMAVEDGVACGLVASYIEQPTGQAHVISMWIAPTHRRSGLGSMLIDTLRIWAEEHHASHLRLMVTGSNHAAIEFYRRIGFSMSGRTEPYPNDPNLLEYEMLLPLRPPAA